MTITNTPKRALKTNPTTQKMKMRWRSTHVESSPNAANNAEDKHSRSG